MKGRDRNFPASYAKKSPAASVSMLCMLFQRAEQGGCNPSAANDEALCPGAMNIVVYPFQTCTTFMYSSFRTTGDFERFSRMIWGPTSTRTTGRSQTAWAWLGRAFHGRVRRDAYWHEACRRVWQSVHHEPLLLVTAAAGPAEPGAGKDLRGCEDGRRLGEVAVLCSRAVSDRRSLVT